MFAIPVTDPAVCATGAVAAAGPVHEALRGQRRELRVPHRVPCRLNATDLGTGHSESVLGETVNISETGLAVRVGRALARGARVEVVVPGGDSRPTRWYGHVAHSRRVMSGTFEVGICFEERPIGA